MGGTHRLELPLLHDHHSHASLYAALVGVPDIGGMDGASAMAFLRSLPGDALSLVKGWRTDALPLKPSDLEALPPILLINASLHGYAYSPPALQFLRALWPEFAVRAADGAWGERKLPELFTFYGELAGLDSAKLEAFMASLEKLGIGSVEDMTLTGPAALRVIQDSPFAGRIVAWAAPEVFRKLSEEDRRSCAGVKIFLDGSLGARSAALDRPFLGGSEGRLIYSEQELAALIAEIAEWHTGLSVHAIGHCAIEQALRVIEALRVDGVEIPKLRFEHVQFVSQEQARRFRDLGAVLSVQPNFNADSVDYADRLPFRLLAENDPFRMLIDEAGFVPGRDLVFGSDGMPHDPANAALWSFFPSFPGQRLFEREFLEGYGFAQGIEGRGAILLIDEDRRIVARIN